MNKKAAFICLLICLLAPIATTYTWLQLRKGVIKKEVKRQLIAGLDMDELVLLKFTEKEAEAKLRWEHSKEFEYNGSMYDIVEAKTVGDTTYYWCWWDYEETKLNRQLNSLLTEILGGNKQHHESKDQVLNFYNSLYHVASFQWEGSQFSNRESEFCIYHFKYNSQNRPPPSPPPQG